MPQTDEFNQLASAFQIIELAGDQRKVTIRGRALPYRPFTLSGSQRNTVEWYPGNPVGVMQVYGAKEETTTIKGMWKDVFLGLGDSLTKPYVDVESALRVDTITNAAQLADVIDDIRRKGSLIQVTWFTVVRVGLLSKFTQTWHTGHDLEYEIEFTWISQGETTLPAFKTSLPPADLPDIPTAIRGIYDASEPASAGFENAFDPSVETIVDAIDRLSVQVGDKLDDLDSAIIQVTQYTTVPSHTIRKIAGVLDGMKLDADDLRQLWIRADGERTNLMSTLSGWGLELSDRATIWRQAAVAGETAVASAARQAKLVVGLTANALAVFQAREGDDLRRVSQIYFGTPDEWQSIMLYNELDDDRLRAGQLVIVPDLSGQAAP